ncbi:MAG: PorT family protein [Bacteroidetes bacterium]|nr:PorT family protein [Bacteroidota bacterium]
MKKNVLLTAIALLPLTILFAECSPMLAGMMHEDAEASIDAANGHYTGDSPYNFKGQTVNENVGFLMSEPFYTSIGSPPSGIGGYFDQPDPLGNGQQIGGGPSNGAGHANCNFSQLPVTPPPARYFSLSEELQLVGKGFKVGPTDGTGSEADHLYYLEIPVLANYNMKIKGGNELRFGFGPYIAAGLFGHYSESFNGTDDSGSLKFGGSDGDYKRMDYGIALNAAYMITPKISVALNYDFGLANVNLTQGDNLYNRSFGLSLGYRIK